MHFTWLDSMTVGDNTIDEQHKRLISILSEFIDACKSNKGIDELEKSLDFLVDYTVTHFSAEEAIQLKCNYPGYPEHKKIHEEFKAKVAGIVEDFKKEGPTFKMVGTFNFEVGVWVMDHIAKEDKKIGIWFTKSRLT
jgi:hemerythrin